MTDDTKSKSEQMRAFLPDSLQDCDVYFSKTNGVWYVRRTLSTRYSPEKKRNIETTVSVGVIRENQFTYSARFTQRMKIEELEKALKELEDKKAALAENAQKAVETVKHSARAMHDSRQESKVQYNLAIVLFVALCSSLRGNTSAVSIAAYWKKYRPEFEEIIPDFPSQDITHDTVNRILQMIKPAEMTWLMRQLCFGLISEANERLFHLDGQATRASKTEKCRNGRYILNVYESNSKCWVMHCLIEEKENEITRSVEVLKALNLRSGDIVTADALNTQRKMVEYILSQQAGYCLAVKENHKKLYNEIRWHFNNSSDEKIKTFEQKDYGHGRIEDRRTRVVSAKYLSKVLANRWAGLNGGCLIEQVNKRQDVKTGGQPSTETRYFISSVNFESHDDIAQKMAKIVRSHWSIEIGHYSLDVFYNQDRMQCKDGVYMANRSCLNKLGDNVIGALKRQLSANGRTTYSNKTTRELLSSPYDIFDTLKESGISLDTIFEGCQV